MLSQPFVTKLRDQDILKVDQIRKDDFFSPKLSEIQYFQNFMKPKQLSVSELEKAEKDYEQEKAKICSYTPKNIPIGLHKRQNPIGNDTQNHRSIFSRRNAIDLTVSRPTSSEEDILG
jgi:hypothetical protein